MNTRSVVLGVIGILVLIAAVRSVYTVHETEQAVIIEISRVVRAEKQPGLHFKMPWRHAEKLERRLINLDLDPQEVTASDQKRLIVDAFARFRIDDPEKMRRATTMDRAQVQIIQRLDSSLRQVLGRQKLETLLSIQRADLMEEIRQTVDQQTRQLYGIEIVDVRIRRADLPVENTTAILSRMEAERKQAAQLTRSEGQERKLRIEADADRQATVILAEAERDSQRTRGEGDREATRIFAEAFGQDEEFFAFYRTMQAYRRALTKDDTSLVLTPDSEFFDYFGGLDIDDGGGSRR